MSENDNAAEDRRRIELGQHHLVDERVISQIIQSLGINTNEVVLELGSGTGKITKLISELSGFVHSYEVDPDLFRSTCLNCRDRSNVKLYNSDLFRSNAAEFDVFFSNLPYSRSKEIIKWLSCHKFRRGVIMIQDEFAAKMFSQPGQRNFCAISVISQYSFELELIATVPPEAFVPPPQVTSKIIRLIHKNNMLTRAGLNKIELLFHNKRKQLSNSNRNFGNIFVQRTINKNSSRRYH